LAEVKIIDPLKSSTSLLNQTLPDDNLPENHWSTQTYGDPVKDDFRVFLTLLWRFLGLPDPTALQLDIAWHLQHHGWTKGIDRWIVMAFRGAAKSWITAAYVLWNLLRDPQLKIGVFSGSAKRSVNFVNFCLNIIAEMPELKHLRPKPNQRQSSSSFDVGPSRPDQTPSVFALGITATVVGFRADIIIGDDVETNKNSMTPDMRDKLADAVREFDAIIKPYGQIIFLGTPQTEASIYNTLSKRGYQVIIWCARYPTGKQRRQYGERLAPWITHQLSKNPSLVGTSTEPTRFSDEDLAGREISWGKAGFALQYMLDTSLADVDRYPLRLRDIIVLSLDRVMGPDAIAWGAGEHLRLRDVQPISLDGDALYGAASLSELYSKYTAISAFIDPSGRGADETTLTIGGVVNATPFLLKQAGWMDGYGEETLKDIARLLVEFNVRKCRIEEDFGQGMFAKLLQPYVKDAWKKANKERPRTDQGVTAIESERSAKVQKELRILEVLEPVFQSHRLVIAKEVLQEDVSQVNRRDGTELRDRYSLMYQITRLTREKDCLTHDDRVEGLSGLLNMFLDMMGLHPGEEAEKRRARDLDEELDRFDREFDDLQGAEGGAGRQLRGKLRTGRQRAR
jgi:hypothetical protein